jgi:hypothetical protein
MWDLFFGSMGISKFGIVGHIIWNYGGFPLLQQSRALPQTVTSSKKRKRINELTALQIVRKKRKSTSVVLASLA